MLPKPHLQCTPLLILSLLIGLSSSVEASSMHSEHASRTQAFQRVEQPLPLKLGVTLGGIALIALELWWFLGEKSQSR